MLSANVPTCRKNLLSGIVSTRNVVYRIVLNRYLKSHYDSAERDVTRVELVARQAASYGMT